MGCSTCSTSTDESPAGCQSNGTCGTSGCNKLNVYNWLSDMLLPHGQKAFDIVEVRFKGSRKEFYRNVNDLPLKVGEMVAVEGNPGHDIGEISMVGELVRFQLKKRKLELDSPEIKLLYRHARPVDIEKYDEVKALEYTTMHRSRTIALQLGLKMKLSDVEFQGDGKKTTFFYTADERVDFRELIKRLADEFKVRIEMRQIGMRQEASRLGGIGSCGRELCCSTWLTDFKIVSTSAARYQNLSLNPIKLAGQCGKLKCCLNYELDTYMDALKDIPETNIKLFTAKGMMLHRKTDIFKRIMWYTQIAEPKEGEERSFQPENWVPMSVDRVKEIIDLNKKNIKPDDAGALDLEEDIEELGYDDVVGQDSLTRMDRTKKKKKKKSGSSNSESSQTRGENSNAPKLSQGASTNNPQRPNAGGTQGNSPQQGGNRPLRQGGDQRKPQQSNPAPAANQNQPQKQEGNNRPPRQGGDQNKQQGPRPQNPQQAQGQKPQQNPPQPKPDNNQTPRTTPPRQRPEDAQSAKPAAPTPPTPSVAPSNPPAVNPPTPSTSSSTRPPRQRPSDNTSKSE
jgi:cell fate regulator YaaT (PSP1 superfamily)